MGVVIPIMTIRFPVFMRKVFFQLLVLFGTLNIEKAAAQNDPNLQAILALDETQFIGNPLDSIINHLPAGYTDMKVRGIRNTARKLVVLYPNSTWIELEVRNFQYMNPIDRNRVWDVMLMRKEELFKTAIYKGTACYEGCPVY